MNAYPGKLALQQRVLPAYRVPFIELLASACRGGLHLFAGQPLPIENIPPASKLRHARLTPARNRHFLHPRHPLYLCWQPGLLHWLEKTDPDALIVEANPRYPSTRKAIAWMHARGRPVIGWGLGAPRLSGPLAGVRARARLRLLSSLDGLIAYSRRGAEEYRALGVLPPERVYTAPNAVTPRPAAPPPARDPTPRHPLTVLFVGRLQPRKKVDHLLKACAALPAALRPRLIIVGDGPARGSLQTLAQQTYPQAEFPGPKHGAELTPYFQTADLFVLPGTGGLAVQQAMSHALPVIVAQGDGTQDDLVRGENGWQIPPDDLPALTRTLQNALAHPNRLRRMGEASYRIASEINIENMAAAFLKASNEIAFRG